MTLSAVDLHYRDVLRGIDLQIAPGECVTLLGANGAGKSTLLRLLAGLLKPDAGEVQLRGQALTDMDRRSIARQLAWVPQAQSAGFPYSVRQLVTLGRLPTAGCWRSPTAQDRDAVEQAMVRMAVEHLAERPVTELSGGERQRVAIARALAQSARILLLDEPATHLDYGHQWRLVEHLQCLADDGYAVLAASHNPEHALAGSTRVMALHDGRLLADGPPRDVIQPALVQTLYGVSLRAFVHS